MSKLKELEAKIQASYEQGTSLEDAEKLAAEFLHAQMQLASQLKALDLDARMRKSGVKAIRSAVYLETIKSSEKKPTEAQIAAIIDSDSIVVSEQNGLDTAEASRDELERYYDIFNNAHIYYRGISKGRFE